MQKGEIGALLHVIFIGKLYYKVRDAGNWHTISPYNYCFVWDFSTLRSLGNVLISKFKCLQNILLSLIVFLEPQLKFVDLNRSNSSSNMCSVIIFVILTKEATVGWRYHKSISYRFPLLIHFNCCCSSPAGYDILLNKTILNLA